MPVTDGFSRGFIRIDGGELIERDGHLSTLPSDQDEHAMRADVVWRHVNDLDSFT